MDIFDLMPTTAEETEAAKEQSRKERKGDQRVCLCGHGARSHSEHALPGSPIHDSLREQGISRCIPARQECGCTAFEGAVTAQDVRLFIYKNTGPYANHPLTKGIDASIRKGHTVEPIGEWVCVSCKKGKADGVTVGPVGLTTALTIATNGADAARNFLMCATCLENVRLGALNGR